MTSPREFATHVAALTQDQSFQREAAQLRAKALLSQVSADVPRYRWTYILPRILRNISLASFELEGLGRNYPDRLDELTHEARRLALLWEALAKLPEGPNPRTALLNAAVNYELAGYQANAACIAKQLAAPSGRVAEPTIENLGALFLQRRFLNVLGLSKRLLQPPEVIEHLDYELLQSLGAATVADGLTAAVAYFLRGDEERYTQGVRRLRDAERLFASMGLVEQANLARSLHSLLPVMSLRSIWTVLLPHSPEDKPRWTRYLRLLARGPGTDVYRTRSVSELWPSQVAAIRQGLLDNGDTKIVRMPTSAGKTRIAELAIVHTLLTFPGSKCIYVAPFRALVSELEQSFVSVLSDLGLRVSAVGGSYETDEFEGLLFHEADVLILTPEKLDLLLRSDPELLEEVKLFVLDEAHILSDRKRGLRYELLLSRLKEQIPDTRFLIASAVVPQETLVDFARWFNVAPEEALLTSEWRPAIQRIAHFEWRGDTGVITYAPSEEDQLLREFVPGVIRSQKFEFRNPKSGRIKRPQFPEVSNKSQICAELALKFAELGPVLVFCSMPNLVNSVAAALQSRLELLSLTGEARPQVFQDRTTRSSVLAGDWLPGQPTADFLRNGIGVHYGSLPEAVRKAVESDFRDRKLQVLVATNTLAQGVNLPFKTVIVHSVWRYDDAAAAQVRLPARDYWNIAGRAGRAGEETEGLIIHVVVSPQDLRDYKEYLSRRDSPEPVQSALFAELLDLVSGRLTPQALRGEIDAEILAMLVEERESEDLETLVSRNLAGTLAHVQARRHNTSLDRLAKAFVDIGSQILTEVSEPYLRTIFAATGLSTESCRLLAQHIGENEAQVRRLLSFEATSGVDDLIDSLLPNILQLQEMQTRYTFAGSNIELLRAWLAGAEIGKLWDAFGSDSRNPEDFARFIEDLFGYRLPWGISAYIRMAIKLLAIDELNLPLITRFLAPMVRNGLPYPEACWAVAAGIPFRKTAIEVASAFREEVHVPDFRSFLEWVNALTLERLRFDFHLASPVLEDVSRAVLAFGRNSLLRDFTSLAEFLPRQIRVAGIKYDDRRLVAVRVRPESEVTLNRDYDNTVDRNAVGIEYENKLIGYVPRDVAQVLAPELDTGAHVRGIVESVIPNEVPEVTVRVELVSTGDAEGGETPSPVSVVV